MSYVNPNLILLKRNMLSGVKPDISDLQLGEIAVNSADGIIFTAKTDTPGISSIVSFLNSEHQPYILNQTLSSVNTQYGGNTVTQVFASVLGGYNNDISGGGSSVVNGEDNDIDGDFSFIGSGYKNKISAAGDYSAILGGSNNLIEHQNSFAIGSNLISNESNFTYVNNISSQGSFYGDGSGLTNLAAAVAPDTEVRSLTSNWNSTYSTVSSLSSNWDSTYTNVQSNSANWQTAYAYVSANSINLTATNVFVANDLTVTDTVSAKYYQGTLIDWMTLVRGTKTTPTLLATIGTGDVYTYVYATTASDKTYYRYIATNGSEDSFYGNFTNPTLSNLIAKKAIIL